MIKLTLQNNYSNGILNIHTKLKTKTELIEYISKRYNNFKVLKITLV